jgi:hypothetical protein
MKRLLFLITILSILALSFINNECDHIYVKVEKESTPAFIYVTNEIKYEGSDLVCVKCFKLTKQVIYYNHGKPWKGNMDTLVKPFFQGLKMPYIINADFKNVTWYIDVDSIIRKK